MAEGLVTGTVKDFDPASGQGTITLDDGQGEVFVDVFGLKPGEEMKIKTGSRVEFQVIPHTTGPRAEEVVILDETET